MSIKTYELCTRKDFGKREGMIDIGKGLFAEDCLVAALKVPGD